MDELGFWRIAEKNPAKLAIAEVGGEKVTYGELFKETNRLVHAIRSQGLNYGDTVAVLMENRIEFMEVYMAIAQAGIYLVPINWHLAAPNIAYILKDSNAKLLFTSEKYKQNAKAAAEEAMLPLNRVYSTGNADGVGNYDDFKAEMPFSKPEDRDFGKVKLYTAGTTGRPKGVLRKLEKGDPDDLASRWSMFLFLFGIQPFEDNVHLVAAPLYHSAPNQWAFMSLNMGHPLVLMQKWTPEETLELIEKYRVTTSMMVPTMFSRMHRLSQEVKDKYDVSSLRNVVIAGAPCPAPLKTAMMDWLGPVIFEYYCATEGGGTLATPEDARKKPGTVGKPWPISEVKILDAFCNELPSNEIGSIYIKMNIDDNFKYDGDQEKTEKAYHDGFFNVGDLGYLDEDGYLFLTDRRSYTIIVGGVNIYPAEIENHLLIHKNVIDVAVFGIPNEDLGEEIKAVVKLTPGVEESEETIAELKAFCSDGLGKFRTPHSIDFVDKMPRQASGKLMKGVLRDPYWKGKEKKI